MPANSTFTPSSPAVTRSPIRKRKP
jgi:hypothetical protein